MANSLLIRQSLCFSSILRKFNSINHQISQSNSLLPTSVITPNTSNVRWSSFQTSHPIYDKSEYPEVEVIKNPPEWKFVERILPSVLVPTPTIKKEYPSGWKPQNFNVENSEFFVARTKNHMPPVYLIRKFRGMRRLTAVKRIQGDIWTLEVELKDAIEKHIGKKIASRVNEMVGCIYFKGDYVNFVKEYLNKKGL